MLNFIQVPVVFAIIGMTIYGIFELFVRRQERLKIIEKIGELKDLDSTFKVNIDLFSSRRKGVFVTLKFASLFAGIGLGLLFAIFLFSNYSIHFNNSYKDIILGATTLCFGGFGLLLAFFVEMYFTRKEK